MVVLTNNNNMVRLENFKGLGNEGLNNLKTIKIESNNEINIIRFLLDDEL